MKKKTRGPGAPKKNSRLVKVPVAFRLPQWIVDKLRENEAPQSEMIEYALREKYGWTLPRVK